MARWGILVTIGIAFLLTQLDRSPAEPSPAWPASAHSERDGLVLRAWLAGGNYGIVAEVAIENRRATPVYLVPDQCGRVSDASVERVRPEPAGRTWTGSVQAVKRLVLDSRTPPPEGLAPRRPGDNSRAVPGCERPHAPVKLAPHAVVRERWALERSYALEATGSENARVAIHVVEAAGPGKLEFLDIGRRFADARTLRVTTPASALVSVPAPPARPSPGELFDRVMADERLRAAISAQPVASWRHADLLADLKGRQRLEAVGTRFERAFTATLASDGDVTASIPGPRDRARVFPERRATLPPGTHLVEHEYRPTRDVLLPRVALPSGRVATGDGFDANVSRYRAEPGTYPVHVTLASDGRHGENVALATVVVSHRRPVVWRDDVGVGTDSGTGAFSSPEAAKAPHGLGWFEAATDSLTAHDDIATEVALGRDTNMVLFSSGFGDGGYPLFVGLDADGRPVRYVLDFRVIHLDWWR